MKTKRGIYSSNFKIVGILLMLHLCLCSAGYQAAVTHLDRRYRLSTFQRNFSFAEKFCHEDDGILAIVNNKEISDVVEKMVNDSAWRGEYPILRTIGVWIGLKLNMNETQALWSDKTLLNETIFKNWAQQPDTDYGRCVQLWPQFFWQWDDTYCDLKKFYICEDKDPANYTKTDLDNLSSSIIKLTMEPNTNTETMNKLSNKLNNLLDISEATFSETISAQKVLVAVDQVTRNYNLTTEGSFYLNLSNIAITITSEVNSTNGLTLGDEMHTMSSSSIFLSNDLIQEASNKGDTQLQISSVIYRKTTLFDVTNPTSTNSTIQTGAKFGDGPIEVLPPIILTHVVSADIKNIFMNDLKYPVLIYHNIPNGNGTTTMLNDLRSRSTEICVFWDFSANNASGGWSEQGCKMINVTDNLFPNQSHFVTCSCNHMTHFAVILSTTLTYEPQYLTILTIIGCVLSLIGLIATLGTNIYFRQLRTKLPQQVLIHLCGSLVLLNLVFLIGIDLNNEDIGCFVVTLFLHYAVLLVWCWMLTEAVFLFRTLVITRVGSSNGQYFIWIAALICYGAPGIVVAASALCLPKSYQSMKYCWLSTDPLLYSIIYPIAVMLLINVIIFIIIMYNITYRSQRFRKNVNLRKISQAVKRAFCMLVVLGLPWVLGYIMLLSQDQATKNIFNILFTIFNSLQGVLIFILYCFRQENVRNLWLKPLTRRYQTNKSRFQTYNFARKFTNDATQDLSATGDIVTRTRRSTDGILSASPKTPKSEDQQEFVGKTNAAFSNPNQGRSTHLNTNPPPLPSKTSPPSNKPFRSGWV